MTLPFKEEKISENIFIRTFYQDVDSLIVNTEIERTIF
jgi:hypothetical protein